jgi:hypothetical protein
MQQIHVADHAASSRIEALVSVLSGADAVGLSFEADDELFGITHTVISPGAHIA